ncbi:NAD(P)-binding protein [Thozetella sp. PMI_491]|nr:NAD(P)-binding protein [Thozetella sp. PMI_491]
MPADLPTTTQGWTLRGVGEQKGLELLTWNTSLPLPKLGPGDVLVKFHAASLNYRDISVTKGTYFLTLKEGCVPGADGVGEVLAVGERVVRFRPGDKVMAYLFQTGYYGGASPALEADSTSLGAAVDGTFREHGVFDQEGLVHMPAALSWEQGAAIMGAYATAWNCLTGGAHPLRVGDCVLVQGSGGVSVAALQLAVAAGAIVIATTSSDDKAAMLKQLGASHVINYKRETAWGAAAKKLSPGGLGCAHVIDIVGTPDSFRQSLDAVARGGEIDVVGFLEMGFEEPGPSLFETLLRACTVRGIMLGSRQQLEEVNAALAAGGIVPVVDRRVFELRELREAYQYMTDQRHFGKVVVNIA